MKEYGQIVDEYRASQFALVEAQTKARLDPQWTSLPVDVRDAHVFQATRKEAERLSIAARAFDKAKGEREDRWITAHEELSIFRRLQGQQ